jgi:hypothetical protein
VHLSPSFFFRDCLAKSRIFRGHIWDRRDVEGYPGTMATVVVPWFADRYAAGMDWRAMASWVHDNLPCSQLQFSPSSPRSTLFGVTCLDSSIKPRSYLTRHGMLGHDGNLAEFYLGVPRLSGAGDDYGDSLLLA